MIRTLQKEKIRLKVCWTLSPKADVDWKHTKKDDGKNPLLVLDSFKLQHVHLAFTYNINENWSPQSVTV